MGDSDRIRAWIASVLLAFIALPLAIMIYVDSPLGKTIGYFAQHPLLGVHELGHYLPAVALGFFVNLRDPAIEFLIVLDGSFAQVFVPAAVAAYYGFVTRSNPLLFCFLAIACFSLWDVGDYMSSAENPTGRGFAPSVGIVAMTPENHDWTRLFTSLGVLEHGNEIAWATENIGAALGIAALFAGVLAILIGSNEASTSASTIGFFGSLFATGFLALTGNWVRVLYLAPATAVTGAVFAYHAYRAWEEEEHPKKKEETPAETSEDVNKDNAQWFGGDNG